MSITSLRLTKVDLAKRDNLGGLQAIYRSLRTSVRWYGVKYEPKTRVTACLPSPELTPSSCQGQLYPL
jgi:hypothetical protein